LNRNYSSEFSPPGGLEQVTDRMGFAMLVAGALHVALVFGVGFSLPEPDLRARSLEITLATHRSETEVEVAEFLAQFSQQATGKQGKPAENSTPIPSSKTAEVVIPDQAPESANPMSPPANPIKVSTALTDSASRSEAKAEQPIADPLETVAENFQENTDLQLASLIAKLGVQQEAYASRPRVMQLTAVAARESAQALYLHNWKSRIESIGNANYPEEARNQRLFGDLRLLVAVRANGSVANIEILQSSGAPVLDKAARQIVRLSEPFEPFPPELSQQADVIEVIRTWRFSRNRLSAER